MGNLCPPPKPDDQNDNKQSKAIPEYKVLVVGDSGVGKTAIIHQWMTNDFNRKHTVTTGVKNYTKTVQHKPENSDAAKTLKLDVWDTAGQEEYQPMNRNFFSGADAVIIVCACDKQSTFKSLDTHLNSIEGYCPASVIKVLVNNKIDLENEMRVTYEDIMQKGDDLEIPFFLTSAIESRRDTIQELFKEVTRLIVERNTKARVDGGSFKIKK